MIHSTRITVRLVAILAVLVLSGFRPATAQSDQDNTNPTGWTWLKGQTPQEISTTVNYSGLRITDMQYVGGGKYDIIAVVNSGAYGKAWWWYTGINIKQVFAYAKKNNARVTVLAPYMSGKALLFGAVMIGNIGADAASWWIYYGDGNYVVNSIASAGGRVIQFKPYANAKYSIAGYVGVGVSDDSRTTLVMFQATMAQIDNELNISPSYRPVAVVPDFNGLFAAILDTENVGEWGVDYNVPSDFVWEQATIAQLRPISIVPYGSGSRLFDAVYIQN